MSRAHTLLERAGRLGRGAETLLLAATLGAMILLAAGQILLRNLGGAGLPWADEALRILVLWVTMLGAVAASGEQRHVSIDALSRYLPLGIRRASAWLMNVFTCAVSAVLAWYSYDFVVESRLADDRVLGGDLPAWAVQLVLPVGFGLIAWRYAVTALRGIPRPAGEEPSP